MTVKGRRPLSWIAECIRIVANVSSKRMLKVTRGFARRVVVALKKGGCSNPSNSASVASKNYESKFYG